VGGWRGSGLETARSGIIHYGRPIHLFHAHLEKHITGVRSRAANSIMGRPTTDLRGAKESSGHKWADGRRGKETRSYCWLSMMHAAKVPTNACADVGEPAAESAASTGTSASACRLLQGSQNVMVEGWRWWPPVDPERVQAAVGLPERVQVVAATPP
jgi:hypothetical protein